VDKPGTLVPEDADIRLAERPLYVSRGGIKLAHALDAFGIDVTSLAALDIGASTGGFTDCLLQRGARRVYAVDVGYGQIDYRLRTDPRVVMMERLNARHPFSLPEPVDLVTVDVSFISVEMVLPNAAALLKPGGVIIVLVKPQFEAGREQVGKGGIVRDPQVHAQVLGRFISWAVAQGLRFGGLVASPIAGAEGNREFLALLRKGTE
ncbi:MAG: TlyA family RNA methyltransferase, partial [Dehalococcoidia bacterium]|nr:TlyA family RNA methyltransferase [Dehalococcoidia bacterium]